MTNYAKLISDFGLNAIQLDDKYNLDGDGEHPEITRWMWRSAVAQQATVSGYCNWLRHQIDTAQDELDRDNPYNQGLREGDDDYTFNEKG